MRNDIHITGYGLVSPLGNDLTTFDTALFAGRSAVTPYRLDLEGLDAASVPLARCEFDATQRTPSRLPADRGTSMALAAAASATAAAGWEGADLDPHRVGVYWGAGMGGAATFEDTCRLLYGLHSRMRPTSVVTAMPNAPLGELALRYWARGAALGFACACASSAVAIGEAMRAIRGGWLDIAIAGGSEAMLVPGVIATWQAMRVLAPFDEGAAATASRPFSADRAGFALGEGAGALVLESEAHARRRGASTGLVLAGYATNCDASHMTNPDSEGQVRAMRAALADAGIGADEIGYLNAHGTATPAGDAAEAASIEAVFGRGADAVPVSSTKAIHGHLLGAGGAVELIATLRALASGRLPPNANVQTVDARFGLRLVGADMRLGEGKRTAMSNSFAFGGTNAVLVSGLI